MSYFTNIKQQLFPCSQLSKEQALILDQFLIFLEDSGVGKIIFEETDSDHKRGGRYPYNPYRMLATIAYGFSVHSGSLRKIEESINYDLRFIYLMDAETPSYVTISKFLNNVVVKRHKDIFKCIVNHLLIKYKINHDDVFIDGTKLEANANKYKFVWKPIRAKKKLFEKIKILLLNYFSLPESKETFVSKEVANYYTKIGEKIESKGIELSGIKRGQGIRNPTIVKDYLTLGDYLIKLLEYEEKEEICGTNRNSYYKTDKDATAMCLKADYYSGLGSNMHAAYNLQLLVSKGMILDYFVSQDRNDYQTFIPFLQSFKETYGYYPKNICADAGYGSYENYKYLFDNNITSFVKSSDWNYIVSGEKTNLYYFDEDRNLYCMNDKRAKLIEGKFRYNRHFKSQLYIIENCSRCRYKKYCQRNLKNISNNRIFEVNYDFEQYKRISTNNLLSTKGIEMRVNRSSQVEGAFGVIKQDMNYERIRRRGIENVTAEIMLVCLGYIIRKLFSIIEGKAKLDYWVAPHNLQPELIPEIDYRKIKLKKRKKGLNEALRSNYKR